jgi:ribosomal protein S18 acetylase RimI-like enzyme
MTQTIPFPYLVRPAALADVDGIVSVGRRVWLETFSHTTSPENMLVHLDASYTPKLISQEIANSDRLYLVAHSADGSAGVAGFAVIARGTSSSEPSVADWPNPVELQRIYVDKAHHGAGLARQLAEEVYASARKEGFESIWLGVLPENTRAVKFYEKCGSKKVGSHSFWVGEQEDVDDIMARLLCFGSVTFRRYHWAAAIGGRCRQLAV